MANDPHKLISLPNRSYQAMARSEIKKMALSVGFSAKRIAEMEIVVAELTSNLVKHTTAGGELLVKVITGDNPGIEIISIDNGPGIGFLSRMMEDGVSSTNTLGQGLGAIRRLSTEFDAYSVTGWGTIILSRIYNKKPVKATLPADVGVVMVPKDGETVCGDNFEYIMRGSTLQFALCDGLGHGPQADVAARKCLDAFTELRGATPLEQLRRTHQEAKKTRGAVMYITNIDFAKKQFSYCGVGNISVKLHSIGKTRSCVSYNGIVGYSIPSTMNNHLMQWINNDLLVIHSDGLTTKWDLQKYPNITRHDRSLIAAALYKDHCRNTDDVSVAVISQHSRRI